jgi:hypothetical protein
MGFCETKTACCWRNGSQGRLLCAVLMSDGNIGIWTGVFLGFKIATASLHLNCTMNSFFYIYVQHEASVLCKTCRIMRF